MPSTDVSRVSVACVGPRYRTAIRSRCQNRGRPTQSTMADPTCDGSLRSIRAVAWARSAVEEYTYRRTTSPFTHSSKPRPGRGSGANVPCGLVAAPARWRSARSPAAPPAFELEGDTEPAGDVPQAATMTITTAPRRDRFIGNTTRAGPSRFPTARGLRYRGTERVAMADLSYPTVPLSSRTQSLIPKGP